MSSSNSVSNWNEYTLVETRHLLFQACLTLSDSSSLIADLGNTYPITAISPRERHIPARSSPAVCKIFARVLLDGNTLSRPSIFLPPTPDLSPSSIILRSRSPLLYSPTPRPWPFLSAWPLAVSEILHIQTWNTPEARCTILPLPVTRAFLLIIAIN